MRPGFTAKIYRESLQKIMVNANRLSKEAEWKGRCMALPIGFILLVSIPIEKFISFLEAMLFTFANIFTPLFPKYCSFPDMWISFKCAFFFFIGFLLSPLTAIFAATALITTMIIHPAKATEKFTEQCNPRL
ncbi:MAG: hypothetical protein AAGG81_02685 [Chlamydiota bacterium]